MLVKWFAGFRSVKAEEQVFLDNRMGMEYFRAFVRRCVLNLECPVATYQPKPADLQRRWYLVDARNVVLGRLATHVATLLTGKGKPTWAPHLDSGDHVIVVNAEKVRLTGNKWEQKVYYRHTGYPGGIKAVKAKELRAKRPDRMVEGAVKGMLPKSRLGRAMAKKLKVYRGEVHPHDAQQPEPSQVPQ